MKTFTVKNDRGDIFQVDENKAHEAEADGFLPVVTNGKEEHRVSFADMPKAQADGYTSYNDYWDDKATKMADIKSTQNPVGVAVRSFGRGLTSGALDEAVGYAGAAIDQLKGTDKTFDESRRAYRNEQRLKQEVDDINYPGLSTTGRIAGGIALGSRLPGAATFAGSVGYGAAQGLGDSEAEDAIGMLKDTATGGAFGAGGYAAGKLIEAAPSIVRNAPNVIKRAANTVGEVTEAVSDGANNKGFMGTITGPMAGVKKVLEIGGDLVEKRKVAEGFRKALGPGHFRDMTDPEVIALMVSEGNDQAIAYVAQRAGRLTGVDPEEFGKLLKANSNGILNNGPSLEDARNFDFRKAGGELVDDVDNFASQLDLAQKARRSELEGIARNNYSGDTQAILDNLQKQIASASELRVTSGAKPALSDVYEIVANGKNAEDLGLQAGNWAEFGGPEQFNRLMKARQLLDNEIDWDAIRRKTRSPTAVERKLMQVRGQIDDALKGAGESKIESDAMYGQYAEMQKRVTGKLKADGDFDKYKVGNMLKDTDGANRFRDNLQLLDEFIANNKLEPKAVEAVKSFRDKFAKNLDTAELRRALQRFETATVGSSRSGRAAQAAESLKRGDNILDELTKAPEQALRTSRNVLKEAEAFFGKPFLQMTQEEKKSVIKFQTLIKKNPNLDFVETAKRWQQVGKPQGSSFAGGSTLDQVKDLAARSVAQYGANEAYRAATGDEEGMPDPVKDQAVNYLTEKYNLSEAQQKTLRRMLPGIYDAVRVVRGNTNHIVRKDKYKPTSIQQNIGADTVTPEDQIKSIESYTGSGAYDFHPQYGTIKDPKADNKWMKDLYKTLTQPDESIQATSKKSSFGVNPATIARKHRPTNIDELKDLQNAKVGETFVTDRPKSFSHEVRVDGNKNLRGLNLDPKHDNISIIVRNNSKGLNIEPLSKPEMRYEAETLVPEGVEYRVVKKIEGPYGHVTLEIEEVGSSVKPDDEPEWLTQFISERSFKPKP